MFIKKESTYLAEENCCKENMLEDGDIISEEEVITETMKSFFAETVETLGIEENQWIMNQTPELGSHRQYTKKVWQASEYT